MDFIENLIFGPKASDNKKRIVKDLKKAKYLPGVWLITLPTNENNILDIVEAYTLSHSTIKTNLTVVGITYGKEEAMEIVRTIVDKSFSQYGTVNIKKYLGIE